MPESPTNNAPTASPEGPSAPAGGGASPNASPVTPSEHIADIFKRDGTTASFEFFPPKNADAAEKLYEAISELVPLRPSFVSVTYGAGGSTRELTRELVLRIRRETPLHPIPHMTGVCQMCIRDSADGAAPVR